MFKFCLYTKKCSTSSCFKLILLVSLLANVKSNLVSPDGRKYVGTAVELANPDAVGLDGQSTGVASVKLASPIDPVEVETANKARLQAELEHEEQARKHSKNVVRLAATDQLNSEIITNRTRAYLSCESGEMIVKINFTEPFRGVGYSDYDRSSPCKFYGDGGRYYEMRLPLKGCGTKQEAPRIFINNIIVRFHRSLELEEDEIKTIICRYPPPLAPPPPLIAIPIIEKPPPALPFIPAKLSEVELLLIVSALLFLTLLLLGIGIGYYCLKKRKIKVVRKFIPPTPTTFTYLPSISSEDRSIISETSIIQRDNFRFDNFGYIPEPKLSYLDDMFRHDQDYIDEDDEIERQNVIAPPIPRFNTRMIDDRYVTSGSHMDIDDDFEIDRFIVPKKPKITTVVTDEYYVTPTTTTEIIDEVVTTRVISPPERVFTTKYIDDTMITPETINEFDDKTTKQRVFGPPKYTKHLVDDYFLHPEDETEVTENIIKQRVYCPEDVPIQKSTQDDYFNDFYEVDEMLDDTIIDRKMGPYPTTRTVQTSDDEFITQTRNVDEYFDDTGHRFVSQRPRQPKIVVKNVDDHYVTNITETEITEQVVKTGRSMPNLTQLEPDYEQNKEIDDLKILTEFDVKMRAIPPSKPMTKETIETYTKEYTSETTKFDEVIRVIENPPTDKISDIHRNFPPPTREKLRTVILTDEVFRTLIIESTTIEEYTEKIQCHPNYGPMFEPPTWDVIFRLLTLPDVAEADRRPPTKKRIDTIRSRVSSHEVRSVTEEDVSFARHRLTSLHFVPLPDYPMDDDLDKAPSRRDHWASFLPDPKHYNPKDQDYTPIKSAFSTTPRRPRQRIEPDSPRSSVFGARHLKNPYEPGVEQSPSSRRQIFEFDSRRPYSPDLDALSLEPSYGVRSRMSYTAYSSGSVASRLKREQQYFADEEQEEIKSTTETNIYDWSRYS